MKFEFRPYGRTVVGDYSQQIEHSLSRQNTRVFVVIERQKPGKIPFYIVSFHIAGLAAALSFSKR